LRAAKPRNETFHLAKNRD